MHEALEVDHRKSHINRPEFVRRPECLTSVARSLPWDQYFESDRAAYNHIRRTHFPTAPCDCGIEQFFSVSPSLRRSTSRSREGRTALTNTDITGHASQELRLTGSIYRNGLRSARSPQPRIRTVRGHLISHHQRTAPGARRASRMNRNRIDLFRALSQDERMERNKFQRIKVHCAFDAGAVRRCWHWRTW